MGAQLNIKSEDAYRLGPKLSELTGESLTTVVAKALRAKLERQERRRDIQARFDRVMEIAKEVRAHTREPVSSDTSWMYDEDGLPARSRGAAYIRPKTSPSPTEFRRLHGLWCCQGGT